MIENGGDGGSARKRKVAFGAGLIILVFITLLFMNSMLTGRDGRKGIVSGDGDVYEDTEYTDDELRLENILENMDGVGDAKVMIGEDAQESTTSVFMDSDSDDAQSGILGVVVIADGAGNPAVSQKIAEATATVCGIPVSSVAVYEMKQ